LAKDQNSSLFFREVTACFLQCCTTPDLKDERLRRVEFSTGTSVSLNAFKNNKKTTKKENATA
jgi:hypothetical protein